MIASESCSPVTSVFTLILTNWKELEYRLSEPFKSSQARNTYYFVKVQVYGNQAL
uniref:Uncharacterized protein n=1 Tax=Loa loa TaxID=7209 RepID=A0A1I7VAA2_LOALO